MSQRFTLIDLSFCFGKAPKWKAGAFQILVVFPVTFEFVVTGAVLVADRHPMAIIRVNGHRKHNEHYGRSHKADPQCAHFTNKPRQIARIPRVWIGAILKAEGEPRPFHGQGAVIL